MPISGIQETCTDILKRYSTEDFERTTRNRGKYYYRHRKYTRLRVIYDTVKNNITFRKELPVQGGTRFDSIIYRFDTGTILKMYEENTTISSTYRQHKKCTDYPFCSSSDSHFQESLMHDKFFPTLDDMIKMDLLQKEFSTDIVNWAAEMEAKKKNIKKKNSKRDF